MSKLPRVLLLSAYDADSHVYWRLGLQRYFSQWQWTVLTLPARYFSWRVRGNSLSWAYQQREILERDYDLLIVTSMCDLSALRGFVPQLAKLPSLVYFHENQFSYPQSQRQTRSVEPQLGSIYTALCGSQIVFNSHYNRDSFFAGAKALLKKLPDQVPSNIVEILQQKSSVLAVPLKLPSQPGGKWLESELWPNNDAGVGRPIRLLWAARWEYDKGPERLLALLRELSVRGENFQLCLLGQRFRQCPPEFEQIKQEFSRQLVQWGYEADADKYQAWLHSADLMLSTAIHEFQGIAVQEAIQAACLPVLPNREVYAELVPKKYLYASYLGDIAQEAKAAADLIGDLVLDAAPPSLKPPADWQALGPKYQALCMDLIETR